MRFFAQSPVRRVAVPADLEAVTTRGPESRSDVDVERIWSAVCEWYSAGAIPAIQICLRRHGEVILNRSIGHAWGNAPTDPPDVEKVLVTPDTPFCVYSAAKGITITVMHMLIERGVLGLGDRVCDYLPNFTSYGKHRITIRHVLTHSAGMPFFVGGRGELDRVGGAGATDARDVGVRAAGPAPAAEAADDAVPANRESRVPCDSREAPNR